MNKATMRILVDNQIMLTITTCLIRIAYQMKMEIVY